MTPGFFFLEGFPRILYADGSFADWVELFPGVRVWWNDHTYTDEELVNHSQDMEHFYAIRWTEFRVKRINQGYICELEINPQETKDFLYECGFTEIDTEFFEVHNLVNTFYSFAMNLCGYNTQIKISCALNMSWTHVHYAPYLYPLQIEYEGEYSLDQWWEKNTKAIQNIEFDSFNSFREVLWKSVITMCTDKSGRYSEFLMQYGLAMQKIGSMERIVGFLRALESLFNIPYKIKPRLTKFCRLVIHPEFSDPNFESNLGGYKFKPNYEHLDAINRTVKQAWEIRNRIAHGQRIKKKHWDNAMVVLPELPILLHWLNRGISELGYLPDIESLEKLREDEFLPWNQPQNWNKDCIWESYEDHIYRYDKYHSPDLIKKFETCKHEYDDYLAFAILPENQDSFFDFEHYYRMNQSNEDE